MKLDFSSVEDVENFVSVPEGNYLCRVSEVRAGTTREGDPRWSFRLTVESGEHAGRTAAWDGVSLSERGMRRAKHVLSKLGFDTEGVLDVDVDDLMDRKAYVQVQFEEREDPITGSRQIRPRVPFLGYRSVKDDVAWGRTRNGNAS